MITISDIPKQRKGGAVKGHVRPNFIGLEAKASMRVFSNGKLAFEPPLNLRLSSAHDFEGLLSLAFTSGLPAG